MEFRIETSTARKLIGLRMEMSLTNNKTFQLWNLFMSRRREIKNNIGTNLFSVQAYNASYNFENFNPDASFEKWAAIEVEDFNHVPPEMEILLLPSGLHAVFLHQGDANDFAKSFSYIFSEWLPNSNYLIDHRPHFEIMGDKYKGNDPTSQEEVWIPIRSR